MGGIRQQLAFGSQSRGSTKRKADGQPSADEFLHRLFIRGRISAPALQVGARAFSTERDDTQQLMTKMGKGFKEGNSSRDVLRALESKAKMPPLHCTKAKVWDSVNNTQIEDDMYFLLPHEVLDKTVDVVDDWIGVDGRPGLDLAMQEFCDRMHTDRTNMAAVGIWGDTAPYHTRDSLFLVVFNVLSGKYHRRFWMTAFPKKLVCRCGCKGRHTMATVWRVFAWSMRALLTGVYPDVSGQHSTSKPIWHYIHRKLRKHEPT
jgi:hypothetical protein